MRIGKEVVNVLRIFCHAISRAPSSSKQLEFLIQRLNYSFLLAGMGMLRVKLPISCTITKETYDNNNNDGIIAMESTCITAFQVETSIR